MNQLLDAALTYRRAGLSVLPCRLPHKAPAHDLLPRVHDRPTWEPLKQSIATEAVVRRWFKAENDTLAVGIIGGAVSGNLEIIDFDDPEVFPVWAELVKRQDPDLLRRLVAEQTLRGGCHIFYRCDQPVEGNLKLARASRRDEATGRETVKTRIETRGEGGYVVVAPSQGYTARYRTPDQVETLTADERSLLLNAARSLDEMAEPFPEPPPPPPYPGREDQTRPGEAFNQDTGMLRALLQSNGWSLIHSHGQTEYWRRPGKNKGGISATWNHIPGRFHVFSSNAHPLESEKTYSPFSLYAFLECGGDFAVAASRLRSIGYGMRDPLAHIRGEEPPPPDDAGPPIRTSGNLAVVPDYDVPLSRTIARDDPDWEPGMDDTDDEPTAEPPSTGSTITELPRPPEGLARIMDQTVIEMALAGERGLGKLAAMVFKDRLLFDHGMKRWYRWAQHHWTECRCGEELEELRLLQMLIQSTAVRRRPKRLPGKNDEQRTKRGGDSGALFESLMSASDSLKKLQTSMNVLRFAAAGDDKLGITGEEWDQNAQWLLPVKNGIVDLRTGELRAGHPSDRLRTVAPTEYDPEAKAPRFDRFIHEIMPTAEVAHFLKMLLGYGITGAVTEHIFPVFWGQEGRNGKDTLIEAIHSVLGPMAAPVSAKSLMAQQFTPDHDSTMMDLRGRRLVWASESNERQALDAAKVKLWTGGGVLTGRPPYGDRQISFMPTHKLVLISNYKPKVSADDSALWRRMALIPFDISFVDNPTKPNQRQVDKTLGEALRQEQKGILRWLVEGCLEWQKNGLALPKTVACANTSYRNEEDIIGSFIEDCLVVDEGSKEMAKAIYSTFVTWCDTNNMGKPVGAKQFTKMLRLKGYVGAHCRTGTVFNGLRLVESEI